MAGATVVTRSAGRCCGEDDRDDADELPRGANRSPIIANASEFAKEISIVVIRPCYGVVLL